ncbi:polyprenal reductase isoform X2 [Podarcis muralis]
MAELWLLLAASFLAALLALRLPRLKTPPGRPSLSLAAVFQDLLRYGKTKSGCQPRPPQLQVFDVPKRWFYHFYVVSVIWNGSVLLLLLQSHLLSRPFPIWLQDFLSILDGVSQDQDGGDESLSVFLVCLFVWLNSCRRLKECLHISVFSGGVIHIVQYCFGLCYYVLLGLTLLCQVPTNVREGKDHRLTVCWYHVLGVLMFIWASVHQHRCHVILANLRKNKSAHSEVGLLAQGSGNPGNGFEKKLLEIHVSRQCSPKYCYSEHVLYRRHHTHTLTVGRCDVG